MGENEVLTQSVAINTDDAVDSLGYLADAFKTTAQSADMLDSSVQDMKKWGKVFKSVIDSHLSHIQQLGNETASMSTKMQQSTKDAQFAELKLVQRLRDTSEALVSRLGTYNQSADAAQRLARGIEGIHAALGEEADGIDTLESYQKYLEQVRKKAEEAQEKLSAFMDIDMKTGGVNLKPSTTMETLPTSGISVYRQGEDAIPVDKANEYAAAIEKQVNLTNELKTVTAALTDEQKKVFSKEGPVGLSNMLDKLNADMAGTLKLTRTFNQINTSTSHLESKNDNKLAAEQLTEDKRIAQERKQIQQELNAEITRMVKARNAEEKRVVQEQKQLQQELAAEQRQLAQEERVRNKIKAAEARELAQIEAQTQHQRAQEVRAMMREEDILRKQQMAEQRQQQMEEQKAAAEREAASSASWGRLKNIFMGFFSTIGKSALTFGTVIKKVVTLGGLIPKLAKKVGNGLRFIWYTAKRLLTRMALQAFFNATGEGLQNLAGDCEGFNNTMSTMVGKFKQFSNQLAAVFAPIIQAAAPYIDKFQDMLQSLAEKVAEFIARLTGQDHYEVALPVEYDFAEGKEKEAEATDDVTDATKKATKARKEYNATVLGFDQLNKLDGGPGDSDTDTSSTKTNTNTKKKEEDTKQRFKRVELDGKSAVQKFADQIRNLFDTSGFESGFMGLSEWLGNKASELVHVFADGLNGHTIGQVVATAINGLLVFIREMFKNPDDWKKIGEELGVALTDAITGIDSDLASDALNNLVLSLLELLSGFITSANWEDIGTKIGEILSKLKWDEILSKTFKLLGQAFSALITMLGAIIGTLIGKLIMKLVDNFKQRMKDSGGNLAYAFFEGVIDIFDWCGEHIIKPFLEGISSIFGDFSSVVPNWKPIKVPEFSMDTMYKASKETGDSKSSKLTTGLTTMMLPPGLKEASLLSTLFSSGKNTNNKANFEDSVERGTEKAMSKYMNQNSETTILLDGEQVGTLLDKANRRRNTRINPKLAMG